MSPKLVAHIAMKAALLLPLMAQGATEAVDAPQPRTASIEVEVTELNPAPNTSQLVARNDFADNDFGNSQRSNRDVNDQSDAGNPRQNDRDSDFG